MRLFIIILITFFTSQIAAEIYTWEDKNGVTHFSESKPETPVEKMKTIQTTETSISQLASNELGDEKMIKQLDIEEKLSQALSGEE